MAGSHALLLPTALPSSWAHGHMSMHAWHVQVSLGTEPQSCIWLPALKSIVLPLHHHGEVCQLLSDVISARRAKAGARMSGTLTCFGLRRMLEGFAMDVD